MGRAPDDHGRFFTGPRLFTDDLCCEGPREETVRSHQLRQYAEHRFLEWNGQQRLSRAANSRGKRTLKYHPGDLVFVWRKQVPHKEAQHKPGAGRFIGPARVLATEKHRDDDGSLRAGSTVWLVRGRRLLKCSVEQLRHASQREVILEELHEPEVQPWDFPRVAKELGGNDYDDLTCEAPSETEWHRANDPELEEQPTKRVRRQARASSVPVPPERGRSGRATGIEVPPPRPRSRSRGIEEALDRAMEQSFVQGPHWSEEVHQSFLVESPSAFWEKPTAMVAVEIEMPETKTRSEKALRDLKAYFTGAMKRRAAEVSERHMTPEELKQFAAAKDVEVNNFIAARAFEALPNHLRAMGLPEESVTKVQRACYGLVDAPLEWYRSISAFFEQLGLQKLWSDPCCWILVRGGELRGIISGHVDDFLFSGCDNDPLWQEACAAIRKEFKWSDWEEGTFTQCGVLVEMHADKSYSLSQEKYVEELKYINLRSQRRKENTAETDAWEQSQLRTLLGGLSWYAQQTAPHLSAEVGLLLSEVNKSIVDTIHRANKLLDQAKAMKTHKLRIHPIPFDELILCAWRDAATHNRPDGSSTQGLIIGVSSKKLLDGECVPVSFMLWQSTKINRVCRSPGASEAIAAVNAEDLLFFSRFQLSEMMGHPVKIREVNTNVNAVTGCLVTDSRNVFDKLSTEVVAPKGAERRVDLEVMGLKAAQHRNGLIVRWVNSEAQLSNPLTKARELKELMLFYDMGQKWCIVEDDSMSSARKRRQKGQSPLEHGNDYPSAHTTYKEQSS
eukprot:s2061_g16.t1